MQKDVPLEPIDPLELIDIGANLAHKSFQQDLEAVIERARAAGVSSIVITGTSVEGSEAALRLARDRAPTLYATAGVHPHDASSFTDSTIEELRRLAGHPAVRALGECGLDYNRNFSPRAAQLHAFEAQLQLAAELQLPAFIHDREAHADLLALLRRYRDRIVDGVIHCFTGQQRELRAYLDLDLHIGITGWICDERRGLHLRELVREIPADRLMLETDSPYLLAAQHATPTVQPAQRAGVPTLRVAGGGGKRRQARQPAGAGNDADGAAVLQDFRAAGTALRGCTGESAVDCFASQSASACISSRAKTTRSNGSAAQRRSCSRRAPSQVVSLQSMSSQSDSAVRVILQSHT